jgi:hypothetical protein
MAKIATAYALGAVAFLVAAIVLGAAGCVGTQPPVAIDSSDGGQEADGTDRGVLPSTDAWCQVRRSVVVHQADNRVSPLIAVSGKRYGIAWQEWGSQRVFFLGLDEEGRRTSDLVELSVRQSAQWALSGQVLAFVGIGEGQFAVAWGAGADGNEVLRLRMVDAEGQPSGQAPIDVATGALQAGLTWVRPHAEVAIYWRRSSRRTAALRVFAADGTPRLAERTVVDTDRDGKLPDIDRDTTWVSIAHDGDGYWAAYCRSGLAEAAVLLSRLANNGAQQGPAQLVAISPDRMSLHGVLSQTGDQHALSWALGSPGSANTFYLAPVRADEGAVRAHPITGLPPWPFFSMAGSEDIIAFAWTETEGKWGDAESDSGPIKLTVVDWTDHTRRTDGAACEASEGPRCEELLLSPTDGWLHRRATVIESQGRFFLSWGSQADIGEKGGRVHFARVECRRE